MNGRLKVIGLLLTPLVIGLNQISESSAEIRQKPIEEQPSNHSLGREIQLAERSPTWYLLIVGKEWKGRTNVSWQVPMSSEQQCEAAALKVTGTEGITPYLFKWMKHVCIKGK